MVQSQRPIFEEIKVYSLTEEGYTGCTLIQAKEPLQSNGTKMKNTVRNIFIYDKVRILQKVWTKILNGHVTAEEKNDYSTFMCVCFHKLKKIYLQPGTYIFTTRLSCWALQSSSPK